MAPSPTANLKVLHDGSGKTVAVKLGELPGEPALFHARMRTGITQALRK